MTFFLTFLTCSEFFLPTQRVSCVYHQRRVRHAAKEERHATFLGDTAKKVTHTHTGQAGYYDIFVTPG